MRKARRSRRKPGKKIADVTAGLEILRPQAAGIDVGNAEHYVAVPPGRRDPSVQTFGSFTADLHRMAQWLRACHIETVVMQATGVYGMALYQVLESYGFQVYVVNAKYTKTLEGRKTEVHAVLDGALAGTFHRSTGDRQALRQVFVITHAGTIAVEVARHVRERCPLAATQLELGDTLTKTLDDLADRPLQDSLGAKANPWLGFRAPFGMEHIGRLPKLLQDMEQIEDERDLEFLADQILQGSLPVGERHVGLVALRIAA